MKNQLFFILFLILIIFGLFLLISKSSNFIHSLTQNSKHQIIVTVLPQKQIVEQIAGDNFTVTALVPLGYGPETYDPTTQELKIVSQAEIYFTIGLLPFEKTHLDKFTEINPDMKVIDTSINNTLQEIEAHEHEEAEETQEIHLDLPEIDPHIWLSPIMVKEQAEIIYQTLIQTYPEYETQITQNYQQVITQLDNLHQQLILDFAPIKGKTILVYHPAFGYLARDYNFSQEYIEIEGKQPSIQDLQNIVAEAKQDNIRVIFVQKQFSQDSAKAIAQNINGVVVEVDPLDPDYFNNMKVLAQSISSALTE
jgi:zinc transport system substrate-binding protein